MGIVHGKDFVLETLRQICIFQNVRREIYFNYFAEYDDKCLKSENITSCSNELIKNLKIPRSDVDFCIKTSFVKSGPEIDMAIDENWILFKQRKAYGEESIQTWPSILVNDMTLRVF